MLALLKIYWIFWEWQKCTALSSAAAFYGGRHMGPLQVMVLPMEVISGPIWRSALKIYFCNVEPKKDRVLFLQDK